VELLVTALRGSVGAEYESTFETLGANPVLLLPATAALLPLLRSGSEGSQVLVHVCSGSVTTVVTIGDAIAFWRNRQLERSAGLDGAEILSEFARVAATCRDHLKSEIEDLYFYVRPPASSTLDEEIAEVTGHPVQVLPSPDVHSEGLAAAERKILEGFGMTFAGLVANRD